MMKRPNTSSSLEVNSGGDYLVYIIILTLVLITLNNI
jgi:hypothetical protein